MSKVVKGVGRVVSKVVDGVKKFAKSKVGKVVLAAAAVYFGAPMIAGALGGASAGAAAGSGFLGTLSGAVSGGLSGAAAGISQAWTGLQAAVGAGSLAEAGTALSGGFSPTTAFGAGGAAATPAAAMMPVQGLGAMPNGLPAGISPDAPAVTEYIRNAGTAATSGAPGAAPGTGLIGRAWDSLGPYGKFGAVQAGSQLVGGVMQGIGAQKQYEQQRQVLAEDRDRYNRNVGTRLWPSVA